MRIKYILTAIAICIAFHQRILAQESSLVYPGPDGKLVYQKHANTGESNLDNVIADFSNCGYMGGGVALPDVPVKITVYPELGDDRKRIQEAINYVSSLPLDENGHRGTVLLKAGTYQIDEGMTTDGDALRILASGVVLRGEGQGGDGTILRTTFEGRHQFIATRPNGPGYSTSNLSKISNDYVGGGTHSFHVEDASGYMVGDTIAVVFTPNQTWLDEIYANEYMGSGDIDWDIYLYTIQYERFITAIEGNQLTIHSPIIHPMQTKYGGGEVKKLINTKERRPQQIGIEHLRLVGVGVTPTAGEDSPDRMKDGVHFDHTENSWVKGVTVVNSSHTAVKTWSSNYITVEDCASVTPLGPYRGGYRYAYYMDGSSSHNLFQRLYSEDGRHDFVLGPRTPGPNVFLDGYSIRSGTIGPHQRWATGTLFDNLSLENLIALEHRGSSGSGHGWAGIQSVIWNTESPTIVCDAPVGHLNYAIGNTGEERLSQYVNNTYEGVYRGLYDHHGSHVETRSLYIKQLEDRLGPDAVNLVTFPQQQSGTMYEELAEWRGSRPIESEVAAIKAPRSLRTEEFSNSAENAYVVLQWDDVSNNESQFVIERSIDDGQNYEVMVTTGANKETYSDTDINQDIYHYRIKAKNSQNESSYSYFKMDMTYEFPSSPVTFQVNMTNVNDLFDGGEVWVSLENTSTFVKLLDEDGDQIYTVTENIMQDIELQYLYAYQKSSSKEDIKKEVVDRACSVDGTRRLVVTDKAIALEAVLFKGCEEALPVGEDITNLEGTTITGSNDDEEWIDGSTGSGSPDGEKVDKLIDNNINTKYLVRATDSWIEISNTTPSIVTGYTITSANDASGRDPRSWTFSGYDDQTKDWILLHTVENNPRWPERLKNKSWIFENDLVFSKYKLHITKINGDAQGLMQMAELQIFGNTDLITSVRISPESSIDIYPVPSTGILNIQNPSGNQLSYKIYDLSGHIIVSEFQLSESHIEINLSGNKGVYFINVTTPYGFQTQKIIIQ